MKAESKVEMAPAAEPRLPSGGRWRRIAVRIPTRNRFGTDWWQPKEAIEQARAAYEAGLCLLAQRRIGEMDDGKFELLRYDLEKPSPRPRSARDGRP